ncbi:MAG TPA: acetyl-CoA C-acetyltransferase [Vicinamibacterales bacterium]|nr:acetyl-CoA C-acetyltransferase [Vicinamibacterales bacterium]
MAAQPLAVILSACRTPVASFGGALKDLSAPDLGAIVVREAIQRAGVKNQDLGEVILGCVLQGAAGMNVARQAAIKAGVPVDVPAETINRVCGSGLQSVVHAVEAVRVGYTDVVVAGGAESMSNAPFAMKGARWGFRMGHAETVDTMIYDGLTDAMHLCHMGMTAEEVASKYQVTREQQDQFAADSQRRTAVAVASGAFDDEIVAVPVPQKKGDPVSFAKDEYPRAGTTVEKLAALRPAFMKDGTVTAGNASGINDGAAAVVVCSIEKATSLGQQGVARILSYATTGVDPMVMGIGPVPAVRKALQRAGLEISDIALFELNEAFAAQSVAVARELAVDTSKVNVNGGAIALGHPLGASGARILTTLIYALKKRGGGKGVASLCIGGGMGIAMVIEV